VRCTISNTSENARRGLNDEVFAMTTMVGGDGLPRDADGHLAGAVEVPGLLAAVGEAMTWTGLFTPSGSDIYEMHVGGAGCAGAR
jgi:hypothetical protein